MKIIETMGLGGAYATNHIHFLSGVEIALAKEDTGSVYLVPVEGEVGPAMEAFVKQSINEAETNDARAIIFPYNTPGGL